MVAKRPKKRSDCRKQKVQRKYTLQDKEQAVALYLEGFAINHISKQLSTNAKQIWIWVELYKQHGKSGLIKKTYTQTSAAFKRKVVREVLEKSLPLNRAAIKYRLSVSTVQRWVTDVKQKEYNALRPVKKPLQPTTMARPKKREPQTELEIAIAENKRLLAENALLKKVKALVEARDARLPKIGCKPSKN